MATSPVFWQAFIGVFTAAAAITAVFISAQTLGANTAQQERQQRQQASERFGRAIDQLASDKLELRLGGIYSLEQLARESPNDHPAVFEVLAAYVRSHALLDAGERCASTPSGEDPSAPDMDIQTAVTVIGRRNPVNDGPGRIDLGNVCLARAYLVGADLTLADLVGANLTGAYLVGANLTAAYLGRANLTDAYLTGANLTGANLTGANLTDAYLGDLPDLDLPGADLTGVIYDEKTAWPQGYSPPPSGPPK